MNVSSNPNICSALFLGDFGESVATSNSYNTSYTGADPEHETYREFVIDLLGKSKREVHPYGVRMYKCSMIMACCVLPGGPTTGQPVTISHFRKFGFHEWSVPKFGKYPHGVIYFQLSGSEFDEKLKAACKELGIKSE